MQGWRNRHERFQQSVKYIGYIGELCHVFQLDKNIVIYYHQNSFCDWNYLKKKQ